jgi:hypothetical protein
VASGPQPLAAQQLDLGQLERRQLADHVA